MPASLIDITPFLPYLTANGLLLTPNNRLKNKILQAYGEWQASLAHGCWPKPKVESLNTWIQSQYEKLMAAGEAPLQSSASTPLRLYLWKRIIAESTEQTPLINTGSLSADADNALKILQQWRLEVDALNRSDQPDTLTFKQWAIEFAQKLDALDLTSQEIIHQRVNDALIKGKLELPETIATYGFDDINPLTQQTFDSLAPTLKHFSLKPSQSNCYRLSLADTDQEVLAAARWAQHIIHQDAKARIGIVVPELGQSRALIERIFTEVFEPHTLLPETPRYTLPFNFSAGIPLGSTALIYDTLQLLRLHHTEWQKDAICSLLSSPFWGCEDRFDQVTNKLINSIMELGRDTITANQLRRLSHTAALAMATPAAIWMDDTLQEISQRQRRQPQRASFNEWVSYWLNSLQLLGWPGHRRPDSNEYQQLEQWYALLDQLSQLNLLGPTLSHKEALEQLQLSVIKTPFQAQTPDSPIQILGALEGAGLQFSHCWVMGVGHLQWPAAASPNPLLPLDLQRQLDMPHASAERELRYAKHLTDNYAQCAETVIFSYPQHDTERELTASPLIQGFIESDYESLLPSNARSADWAAFIDEVKTSARREWVNVTTGPDLAEIEKRFLKGGAGILKQQAACPFSAFATYRLGIKPPVIAFLGLSPMDRGNILHDALFKITGRLPDKTSLMQQSEESLKDLIAWSVEETLHPYRQRYQDQVGPQYFSLESERQQRLISHWLNLEKSRPDFRIIERESTLKVDLAGLPLTLRLDRLDQLSSGELVIIDYKTGSPAARQWQGERPEEPQLPLYTLCYSQDIHAILFAQINAKAVQVIGLGQLEIPHEGITQVKDSRLDLPSDWTAICEHWQRVLTQLSEDFVAGEAQVDFSSPTIRQQLAWLIPLTREAEHATLQSLFQQTAGGDL